MPPSEPPPAGDSRTGIERLRQVMARLRDPAEGCPWDLEQSFATIAAHTLEECYELVDAIEREDRADMREELGDVLFQVVFYSRLAEEEGWFDLDALADGMASKLIRRHPHVFADGAATTPEQVSASWEQIKQHERDARRQGGVLDDVPLALPALSRAAKLQRRAARVGFDWAEWSQVLTKLDEERDEVIEAVAAGNAEAIAEEVGDLLFVCVNLARHLGVDPEGALRASNRKFERRFAFIENALQAQGRRPEDASLEQMDTLWSAAKRAE